MNNDHSPRYHGMSFFLQEHLRKTLHLFAEEAGDQLHGACLLTPPSSWKDFLPQGQVDAWLTLQAWFKEGEPVAILPEFSGWQHLHFSTAGRPRIPDSSLRNNTAAFRLGKSEDWVVLARHEKHTGAEGAAPQGEGENWIVFHGNDHPAEPVNRTYLNEGEWRYKSPALSYIWSILGIQGAGTFPLHAGSSWDSLPWPTGEAVDPVTGQHRALTKRVRYAFLSGMGAAIERFSRSQPAC